MRVITGEREPPRSARPRHAAAARRCTLNRYLAALGFVAVAGVVAKVLQLDLSLTDYAMVFLTGVLFSAVVGGLGPSILAALVSLLVYDFFFVDPLYTFTVTKPQDVLSLFVFLVVAVLTSNLTARIRDQAAAARRREERTAALYAFSRQLAAAVGIDDLAADHRPARRRAVPGDSRRVAARRRAPHACAPCTRPTPAWASPSAPRRPGSSSTTRPPAAAPIRWPAATGSSCR